MLREGCGARPGGGRFKGALSCALLLTLASPSARADGDAPTTEEAGNIQARARAAFAAGEEAFARGDYSDALAEFKRAFSLRKHDAVRFNIAVCLERLSRYREAKLQYQAAAASTTLGPADRARARRALQLLTDKFGVLVVEQGKSGRAVVVNSRRRCSSPCRVELLPGRYRVQVGSADAAELELKAGRETVIFPTRARAPTERPHDQAPKPRPSEPSEAKAGPGLLFWSGGALALVGGAGTVFFGLRTERLHDDYTQEPTRERLDDGRRARLSTNVSLGVAVVGASLMLIDLLLLDGGARAPEKRARHLHQRSPRIHF